jgi:hypothetical protein
MFRRSLCTTFVTVIGAASALAAQGPNTAAFRSGLVAVAASSQKNFPLQTIALHWPSYSAEKRYRVLRSASPGGPWFADHEVLGVIDTVRRLPPNVPVYIRVVALHQASAERWVAADTTNATLTVTPQSVVVATGNGPGGGWYALGHCDVAPPSTLRMSWNRTPDANGYRLRPTLWSVNGAGSGSTFTILQDILVRDTVLIQTNVPAGTYKYALAAQYDIANWPGAGQTLTVFGPTLLTFGAIIAASPPPCTA